MNNEFWTIVDRQIHYENIGLADGKIDMVICTPRSIPQEFRKCYWDGFVQGLLMRYHQKPAQNSGLGFRVKLISENYHGYSFQVVAQTETSYYLLDETGRYSPMWIWKIFCNKV